MTKIEYNGSVVATVEGGNTATLPIKDLKMKSDIVITVPEAEVLPEFTEVEDFAVFANGADEGSLELTYSVSQDVKLSAASPAPLVSIDDANFIANNIKKDVSIFGLTGAYEGEAVEEYDGTIAIGDIELAGTWAFNRAVYFPLDFDAAKTSVDNLSIDERIDFLTIDCDIYINGALASKPTLAVYGSALTGRRGIYLGDTDGTNYTTYAKFYQKQNDTVTANMERTILQVTLEITNITNVSNKEEVLAWLEANATKQ